MIETKSLNLKQFPKLRNTAHRMTMSYHPQTTVLTEQFNDTLTDMLSIYVDVKQKDRDEVLPFVIISYNIAKQETTYRLNFLLAVLT